MVVEDFYKINRKKDENILGKTLSVPVLNDKNSENSAQKERNF